MDFQFELTGSQWIAVAIGAVQYMALSAIWYMPKVFGNVWMSDEGLVAEDLTPNPMLYVFTLIMALISNVSIALILSHVGGGFVNGLVVGLVLGIGIAAMSIAPHYMFAGKNRLSLVQGAHAAVLLTVSGIIIGLFT